MKNLLFILLFIPLVSFGQEIQKKNKTFDELKEEDMPMV
jgi:hypothetical protein